MTPEQIVVTIFFGCAAIPMGLAVGIFFAGVFFGVDVTAVVGYWLGRECGCKESE